MVSFRPVNAAINRAAVCYGIAAAIVLAIQALSYATQERITVNSGRGYDGAKYYDVAEQFAAGKPPAGEARFARRLGTPWLAALVKPEDLIAGFTIVNACAAFTASLLLFVWLRRYLHNPWLQIALVAVYAAHWLQLVRFSAFYPVLVDACAQACCFAGLNCIASYEQAPARWKVFAITAISAAGACFREVVLLVPLAFLFARNLRVEVSGAFPYVKVANRPRLIQWVPLAAAVAALAVIANLVVATDAGFSASNYLLNRALARSLLTYLLGWMVAFGPALFLILFDWRTATAFLARHTWMVAYLLGVAIVGWAGSLESERHALNWGAPVIYVLVGCTIQRHFAGLIRSGALGVALLAYLLASRVFWTTPQPVDDYLSLNPTIVFTAVGPNASYLHLLPDYLPRETAWMELVQYLALGFLMLILMRSRAAGVVSRGTLTDRAGWVFDSGRRIGLTTWTGTASGVRQRGIVHTLRVVGLAFVTIGTLAGTLLLLVRPAYPVPIHVRWKPDVDAARRSSLEQELALTEGRWTEGTTFAYLLTDPSTGRIRTIVGHPSVDDTEHLNRTWFRPDFEYDRERRALFYGALAGVIGAVAVLMWTTNAVRFTARSGARGRTNSDRSDV